MEAGDTSAPRDAEWEDGGRTRVDWDVKTQSTRVRSSPPGSPHGQFLD